MNRSSRLKRRLLVPAGLALAPFLWLLDATIDHFFFAENHVSYLYALLHPEPVEIWMRGMVWLLTVAFTFYAYRVARTLQQANVGMRRELAERIRLETEKIETDRRERELGELLRAIATTPNDGHSIGAAMKIAAERICHFTGWSAGDILIADRQDGSLRSIAAFPAVAEARLQEVVDATSRVELRADALKSCKLITAEYAVDGKNGLQIVAELPVVVKEEVVAVLEFLSFAPQTQWPGLENMLANIASQLANLFERDRARGEILEASRMRESILNTAADGIVGLDASLRSIFVNHAAADLLELAPDGSGSQAHEVMHEVGDRNAPEECPACLVRTTGMPQNRHGVVMWKKGGDSFRADFSATPMRDAWGKLAGIVTTFKDISGDYALEKMKSEFVSTVSHELRTPLTSIYAVLRLLDSGKLGALSATASRMVSIAALNTERLSRLINDILDLEKLEAKHIPLDITTMELSALLRNVADGMLPIAMERKVTLTVVSPGTLPIRVDPDRITQVLTNLIGNAIKFSPEHSTVTLSARTRDDSVLIEVRDEGRGIPADKLASIFDRFKQVDSSDTRDRGGTGLGLAIVKSIVERHGGRVEVESELGKGSVFTISIPMGPGEPSHAAEESAPGAILAA